MNDENNNSKKEIRFTKGKGNKGSPKTINDSIKRRRKGSHKKKRDDYQNPVKHRPIISVLIMEVYMTPSINSQKRYFKLKKFP